MHTTIHPLTAADVHAFSALLDIFNVVFEQVRADRPDTPHLQRLLADPGFLALTAIRDQCVIGGLTAYVLTSYTHRQSSLYLYDLGVAPEFHRQGVGRSLIRALLQLAVERGYREVFVQADADDPEAIVFYRATGAREDPVHQFSYQTTVAGTS